MRGATGGEEKRNARAGERAGKAVIKEAKKTWPGQGNTGGGGGGNGGTRERKDGRENKGNDGKTRKGGPKEEKQRKMMINKSRRCKKIMKYAEEKL